MNMEKKINKIGMFISTGGILLVIAIAMINYFSIDNFVMKVYGSINYYFRDPLNADLTLTNKLDQTKSSIENTVLEIFLRDKYIDMNTQIDLLLGDRLITDSEETVGVLDNGYLSFISEDNKVQDKINNFFAITEQINYSNPKTEILYVQAPFKISKFDRQLPDYITENSNYVMDEFLKGIEGKVDYIDLRQLMYDQGKNQYDYFLKTDHHWTAEGAFWATNEISKTIQKNYGYEINYDYLNLDNFTVDVYEDILLGSEGKRVGELLAGKDDFSIISPNFESNFTLKIEDNKTNITGSFQESLLDYDRLEDSPYSTYLGGDFGSVSIKNNNSVSDKSVLIIKDSFANSVAPFLSLNFKQLNLIDLRHFNETSLQKYIQNINPDLVIFLYTRDPLVGYGD